jgi:hypothetical protein
VLALENRRLLTTFDVNSAADDGSIGTLRWAVERADVATTPSTIDFTLGTVPATITLSQGGLELSNTAESTTIIGPGTGLLTIRDIKAGSVFQIDRTVSAALSGLTITGGSAGDHGGGVNNSGAVVLSGCTLSGNSAQYGGGLFNEGTATLTNCMISGNTVTFDGAGVYNDGTLTITGSTITANTSNEAGGGLQNEGTAALTNCTIGFNTAQRGGGGMSNFGTGPGSETTLTVMACTITGNTASEGGGLYNHKGLINPAVAALTDTIVAGNTVTGNAPSDIGGQEATSVTGSFNLIGIGGAGGIEEGVHGNIFVANLDGLGLAPLRDYGGPTETIALLPGSAAFGTGTPIAGVTTDQRGFALDTPSPDIGAFQTQTAPLVVGTVTDNGASPGLLDLRAGVDLADLMGGEQTITFDPAVFGTTRTITLTAGLLKLSNTAATITIDGPGANLLSINGNRADPVFQINHQVRASLSGLTITGGSTTGVGGGVLNLGSAILIDCTLAGNSAGYGGGLFNDGTLALDHCTISGNSASIEGGGVWSDGTATLKACTISDNTSADIGGGIDNHGSALTLTGCTIGGNVAQHFGGGVYNQGSATLQDCTITGNTAQANGGGLATGVNGLSTLIASTISGNAAQEGGGLENYSTTTLTNCTISGNRASSSGGGVSNSGTVMLTACTISGNVGSVSGGGIYNHDFLDNRGAATLTDTIVADNSAPGGSPSDIGGQEATRVTGSFNLIGIGGAGGIDDGAQGNIVLASLSGLGLGPQGDYGGPTQTVALLPGSPALGAGTALDGITIDQRGEPDGSPVDIGAFQSQGFTLTAAAGSDPQSATASEAFANPLAVSVVARNPVEPVIGGTVSFAVTPAANGAGADLTAPTASIGANGLAQVDATANATAGSYIVLASAAGAVTSPNFRLTNLTNDLVRLAFAGLTSETIIFGTGTVTVTGTLANGVQTPPQGESVAVTLAGVTQEAVIGAGGAFATTFATADLNVEDSPYTILYTYAGDGRFASVATTSLLMVTPATPSVGVAAAGGAAVFGQPVTFVASVTSTGTPGGSVTFDDGTLPLGTVPLDGFGSATLTLGSLAVGSHTITASYSGDLNLAGATSGSFTESIAQAGTEVILARVAVLRKKKVVSVRLTAEVEPLAPAAGIPGGTVRFMVNKKTIGTRALEGGAATLNVKTGSVSKKPITLVYGGDASFLSSKATLPLLTRPSVASWVRPMVTLLKRPARDLPI